MKAAAKSALSPALRKLPLRAWLLAGAAFLFALLLCGALIAADERMRHQERTRVVTEVANLNAREIGDRLERALSASFALTAVLRQGGGQVDRFETLAREMINTYGGIAALQLAPGGVIEKIVPLAGNERALGFNPLLDPVQGFEAQRAIDTRRLTLAGPFELVQGGFGVVGRYPVFLPDKRGDERFWGLVQVIVRIPDLLAVTSLGQMEAAGYRYTLWRIDPATGERVVFARTSDEPLRAPVDAVIRVPEGRWALSVEDSGTGTSAPVLAGEGLVALLLSLLVAGATLMLLREPLLLQREIDERRAVQEEMQRAAERLRQIINTMDSGIVLWDSEQRLVAWNEAFERIFADVRHALQPGMPRRTLVMMLRAAGDMTEDATAAANDWDALGAWDRLLPDGRVIAVQRMATSDGGRLTLHTDVTAVRRANEVLARNDRMASLGRLVAGIAHEINTPIGNALMVATSVQQRIDEMAAAVAEGALRRSTLDGFLRMVRESDEILVRNLGRAAELIQHFKQVAVDQTSDRRRTFDLATVLDEVVATLMPRLKRSTHALHLALAPDLTMDSYPGALGQIVTNLIENSLLHAFPERSDGSMRLVARALDETYVEILYSDDGVGIPAADRSRVFDPFFTTRMGQGGSGLGLSIVLNLVRDLLGGDLDLSAGEPRGTTFRLRLPRVAPQKEGAPPG